MATTYHNAIQQLYVAYFNRPADPTGQAFWEKAIESANGSTAAVAAAFAASAEYTAEYKGMTNTQIVDQVYQNLFGRSSAGDKGADFWIDKLDKGVITIDQVVTAVAAGAQGTDMTAFNNKVIAATQFTAALDTQAEIAGYAGDDANAIAKDFLAGVTTNSTLSAAIEPANLNTVVAEAVSAGTEFSVNGALQSLASATAAEDAYLKSITDEGASADMTAADVAGALTDAEADFTDVFTAQDSTAEAAWASATSKSVKAAIIDDQVAHNVEVLAADQKVLTSVNAEIAGVTGLATAIAKLDAAMEVQADAHDASDLADTNLVAQEASFEITAAAKITANGGTVEYNSTTGTVTLNNVDDTKDVNLIVVGTDGTLKLGTGVKEADYAGVTALLNSMKAAVTAHTTAHNADLVAASAQASVDKLDVDSSEAAALAAVKTAGAFTTTPTYTQAVQKDVDLKAAADAETVGTTAHDAYTAYHTKFAIYDTAYKANPLYDAHTDAQAAVDADVEAISDFNDALAALTTAQQHAADLAGYQATIDAATSVFAANDYNLVMLDDTALTTQVATASSDVYVVDADSANTSISLFGSQGTDSISIGTGFTLNTGKLSTGNDAVKEVFIAQSGTNTVIQVETSVFGSNAATPEVVKITLVGVTATDVHLDANGIISVGSPTA